MTNNFEQALASIEKETDVEKLLQWVKNARGKSPALEAAAFDRLIKLAPKQETGTLKYACWQMVWAVETLRKINGHKISRMNRLRPKIEKDGEIAALAYCVKYETRGFDEVMNYDRPDLTAEWIVLQHPQHFSAAILSAARKRLASRGVEINGFDNNNPNPNKLGIG